MGDIDPTDAQNSITRSAIGADTPPIADRVLPALDRTRPAKRHTKLHENVYDTTSVPIGLPSGRVSQNRDEPHI